MSANEGEIQNAIGDKIFAKARGCQLHADNDGANRENPVPPVVRSMSKLQRKGYPAGIRLMLPPWKFRSHLQCSKDQ